jgi:excinuclease UvrABC helicase subunit UvrB
MSSKSSSNSNKENINDNNDNISINLLIEGLALTQSAVVSLIDAYSEFLKDAPKK